MGARWAPFLFANRVHAFACGRLETGDRRPERLAAREEGDKRQETRGGMRWPVVVAGAGIVCVLAGAHCGRAPLAPTGIEDAWC
ncbi:hypothetical protein CR163_004210 [Prosthecochloris sp. ZM_2]|nr:hypothetical protein CR163_004210 [Prosthecochloris sp. ZM_2]